MITSWLKTKNDWWLIIAALGMLISLTSAVFLPATMSLALTNSIDPDGDGSVTGFSPTGSTSHFATIDDGTRQPNTPNTSDYISGTSNGTNTDFFTMSTIPSVQSLSEVTVWIYHTDGNANARFYAQLFAADETTTYSSESVYANRTTNGWSSVTFSGLSLNQSQLDDMRIRIRFSRPSGGQPSTGNLYAMYAEAAYSAGPIISLVTDGVVDFGAIPPSGTRDTTSGGINDVQTVSIDGDPVDLDIRSTVFSDGSNTWSLGTSTGNNQVHWQFSLNGSSWTDFAAPDTLYTLDSNVPNGATRNLYLRLGAPNTSSSLNEHSAMITIVASVP
ncbi:MAG TPA: hypothetical protein VF996_00405 [Candidatus Saccharimonadales bacterium]